MWRIKLVELGSKQQDNEKEHEYCLILGCHHAITDGMNVFYILDQLLAIVEHLVHNGSVFSSFDDNAEEALSKFHVLKDSSVYYPIEIANKYPHLLEKFKKAIILFDTFKIQILVLS